MTEHNAPIWAAAWKMEDNLEPAQYVDAEKAEEVSLEDPSLLIWLDHEDSK